jgi:phosphatidylserine/phosphatidylglycerophosphate/cardiolipin synthase-like enzyme
MAGSWGGFSREEKTYLIYIIYVVQNDTIARRLRDALIEKARSGVRVHFYTTKSVAGPCRNPI